MGIIDNDEIEVPQPKEDDVTSSPEIRGMASLIAQVDEGAAGENAEVSPRGQNRAFVHIDELAHFPADSVSPDADDARMEENVLFRHEEIDRLSEDSPNVTQDHETFMTMPEGTWDEDQEKLALPYLSQNATGEMLRAAPDIVKGNTQATARWAQALEQGYHVSVSQDQFQKTVARIDSRFRQSVGSEKGELNGGRLKFTAEEGTKLTGERAIFQVRGLLGLGSVVQIPLWHSGVWISIKAPAESDLLELNRLIANEKISLGRQTYGLAYANASVFFAGHIVDFVLRHIFDSSLKDKEELRGLLSAHDIYHLAWGLACAVWPKGFQYIRSVLSADGVSTQVIEERLNVTKLQWTDNLSLNKWQLSHMAQRHGRNMTVEQVKRYQDEFTLTKGREVVLKEGLKMVVRVPTVDQYLQSGQQWVNNIVLMVDRAASLTTDNQERNNYIISHGKATLMRQYGHYVESVSVNDNTIDDPETIEGILNELSQDDEVRKAYFAGIASYIDDTTISVIAVPTINEREKVLPRFPHLLPIDSLVTFFTLLVQRVNRIADR